jgi:hypothetical protein
LLQVSEEIAYRLLLLLIRLAVSNTRWYRNVTYVLLRSMVGYNRRYVFSCCLYQRFRTAYRYEMSIKTTVKAVKMPATVLWEGIFVVNTTPRDATLIVLHYQVALLQEADAVGAVAVLLSSPLSR